MGRTNYDNITENPIVRAREAGYAAGEQGASDVVPADIATAPLAARAWMLAYQQGRIARSKQAMGGESESIRR
jgi:hypothetical protein